MPKDHAIGGRTPSGKAPDAPAATEGAAAMTIGSDRKFGFDVEHDAPIPCRQGLGTPYNAAALHRLLGRHVTGA